jgi:post-segregation antitoxin (ccd killing protein)
MIDDKLITHLQGVVKDKIDQHLASWPLAHLASLDLVEALVRSVAVPLAMACFDSWMATLERATLELARPCPSCGRPRKCKWRSEALMQVQVLGLDLEVPKLYLECGHCDAPGVSITRLLTGLTDGDASTELALLSAYSAAEHSYRDASRELEVHQGQVVERTMVRRLALEVEELAKEFAEQQRQAGLALVAGEARREGVERLMVQGDGGVVRTGKLVECEPVDPGYGQTTAKRGKPKRKRVLQNREVITLDVREPGQMEPKGLDVVVPCVAEEGERATRMLATAARSGLGDNTEVLGLGDLGSQLPESFDEAFIGHTAIYCGDWKHVRDYVAGAKAVLEGPEEEVWQAEMLEAIWTRNEEQRDELLREARERRVKELPQHVERCPVQALTTYLHNNWERMQAARFKGLGVDFVSARAEAQVRERTKRRFAVAGAWREENLEGKATLRALIDEGSWERFCQWVRARTREQFRKELVERLEQANREGRLSSAQVGEVLGSPSGGSGDKAKAA